jgi:hypothetical protein
MEGGKWKWKSVWEWERTENGGGKWKREAVGIKIDREDGKWRQEIKTGNEDGKRGPKGESEK